MLQNIKLLISLIFIQYVKHRMQITRILFDDNSKLREVYATNDFTTVKR